ncbi:MAG: Bax inhibitor-1/YccA family protein [Bryobacterales bacterium]|nr:Bax inhibitor-1/YccA family protein [Bryobacterales bacterium]
MARDMFRTSNPALNDRVFQSGREVVFGETMTVNGVINKSGFLLLLVTLGAIWPWTLAFENPANPLVNILMIGGLIGGLVMALITTFKKEWAPVTAPAYALLEGLALGGISAIFEMRYPGVALQAVALTFAVLGVMLLAYRSGWIKVTEKFKLGVVAATGAIFLVYMAGFVLGFFGIQLSFLYGNSLLSIGISGVIVVVAALNLVLDFDLIEQGVRQGAPRRMEWYAGFALMVTLVWLYLELLRLLSKINSRR